MIVRDLALPILSAVVFFSGAEAWRRHRTAPAITAAKPLPPASDTPAILEPAPVGSGGRLNFRVPFACKVPSAEDVPEDMLKRTSFRNLSELQTAVTTDPSWGRVRAALRAEYTPSLLMLSQCYAKANANAPATLEMEWQLVSQAMTARAQHFAIRRAEVREEDRLKMAMCFERHLGSKVFSAANAIREPFPSYAALFPLPFNVSLPNR